VDSQANHPDVTSQRRSRATLPPIPPGAQRVDGPGYSGDYFTIIIGEEVTAEPSPPTLSAQLVNTEEEIRIHHGRDEFLFERDQLRQMVDNAVIVTHVVPSDTDEENGDENIHANDGDLPRSGPMMKRHSRRMRTERGERRSVLKRDIQTGDKEKSASAPGDGDDDDDAIPPPAEAPAPGNPALGAPTPGKPTAEAPDKTLQPALLPIASEETSSLFGDRFTIPVGLCLVIYSINDINSKAEMAEVDMGVALFLRGGSKETLELISAHIYLISAITIKCKILRKPEDLAWIKHPDILPGVVAVELHATATFKLGMEVTSFPFDVQDLLLRLYCDTWQFYFESAETYFDEQSNVLYANALVTVPTVLMSQEWGLEETYLYYDETDSNETMFEFWQINVHVKLVRKGEGFLYKDVPVLFMISLASWLPLGLVDVFSTHSMLTYEVGLLFTVASYRSTFQSYLPISPSVSIIEWYAFFFVLLHSTCYFVCGYGRLG
jgi:hypothetical protein